MLIALIVVSYLFTCLLLTQVIIFISGDISLDEFIDVILAMFFLPFVPFIKLVRKIARKIKRWHRKRKLHNEFNDV